MHSCQHLATSVLKKEKIYYFNSKSIDAPNAGRSALGYRMGHRMGYRMGYIRALMGYRRVCEVAFQRVRFEEAALGGRAGFRVDSGLGRVGWAGRRGGSSRGRAGLGSGQASVGLVWVKLRVGSGWVRGRVGSGSGRARAGSGFFRSGRVGPGRVGFGLGSGGAGLRTTKAPRGSKTSAP